MSTTLAMMLPNGDHRNATIMLVEATPTTLEEIAVKQSSIIDSVNTIRNFSNKKPEESDNASNNENSCAAMLFRMKTADKF